MTVYLVFGAFVEDARRVAGFFSAAALAAGFVVVLLATVFLAAGFFVAGLAGAFFSAAAAFTFAAGFFAAVAFVVAVFTRVVVARRFLNAPVRCRMRPPSGGTRRTTDCSRPFHGV